MGNGVSNSPPADGPAAPPNALTASRYLAWLYSPPAQQPALAALCEIESEVVSSIRPGIDHHVAHARLQWWREECERLAQGRPVHPLTRKLAAIHGDVLRGGGDRLAASAPSPVGGISGFVDTAVWDLAGATFETRKELTVYCERWATAMFQSAAAMWNATGLTRALAGTSAAAASRMASSVAEARAAASNGASGAAAADASAALDALGGSAAASGLIAPDASRWRTLGAAVREIELLANLQREAHAGRLRVPLDELELARVDFKSVSKLPWPDALVDLLTRRHQALRVAVADSVAALGREEQAGSRGLMVWAALAWRQSWRAQRALPNVVLPRRYDALADGWRAWRAARCAVSGNLRLS